MYYVYVLYSPSKKKLYKGSTGNLRQRVKEHNLGSVPSTKPLRPLKLVYYEVFRDKTDALIEERFLKTGKGRERLGFLLKRTLEDMHS